MIMARPQPASRLIPALPVHSTRLRIERPGIAARDRLVIVDQQPFAVRVSLEWVNPPIFYGLVLIAPTTIPTWGWAQPVPSWRPPPPARLVECAGVSTRPVPITDHRRFRTVAS